MLLRSYKPYTPSVRSKVTIPFLDITKINPEKSLTYYYHRSKGRNNSGKITIRHKGGGHKKLYRIIDFKRNKFYIKGIVSSIEYDPYRNCNISLINYLDGEKRYILHPENLSIGSFILSGKNSTISNGNSLPLEFIPLGTKIHNVELIPGRGGKIIRSAGVSAKVLTKSNNFVFLELPSKEIRAFHKECYATIGTIDNNDFYNTILGKAGRSRWLGIRPTTRGAAMNPIDHPHGGGEGKSPIGRSHPLTPWGKPALGVKTRKNKKSNKYIIKYIKR